MDQADIERVRGKYQGRNRSCAYRDLVFTVGTAEGPDITVQTRQTLAIIEQNLAELGSHKHRILSAQVYLADMRDKPQMDAVWCEWLGADPQNWPQRACLGVALAGDTLVEIVVTAARE
jgi:enamine deaminase RidA (YjgF/YER057c/UK114 family)